MSFFSIRNLSWFFSLIVSGFLLECQSDSPSMDPMSPVVEPMPEPPVAHPKNTQYPICPNGFCFKNPSTGGNTIRGFWGSGDKDVWAVGDYGTILHYDGKIWSLVPSPTKANLKAVWGSSYDNVYAIGEQGTLLHYTESLGTWNSISLGIYSTLWGIWGDAPNHIWIVGDKGTLWALDGKTWNWKQIHFLDNSSNENNFTFTGIWGNSTGDIWIAGSKLLPSGQTQFISLQWDGKTWHPPVNIEAPLSALSSEILPRAGIIGFEPNDLFVLCIDKNNSTAEERLYHFEKETWNLVSKPQQLDASYNSAFTGNTYQGLFGFSANDIWIPNINGAWHFLNQNHFEHINLSLGPDPNKSVHAIWGSAPNNVWLSMGDGGLAHFNGQTIDFYSDSLQGADVLSMWIRNDNDLWVSAGFNDSFLAHFQANSWNLEKQPRFALQYLTPIDENHSFLQPPGGPIWSWNGYAWQEDLNFEKLIYSGYIRSAQGISSSQALVINTGGVLFSYDGNMWQPQLTLSKNLTLPLSEKSSSTVETYFWANSFQDVWVTGRDCVYAPGLDDCNINHEGTYTYWMKHSSDLTTVDANIPFNRTNLAILGIWSSDANHLWIIQNKVTSLWFSDGKNLIKDGDPTHFAQANLAKEQPIALWGRSLSDIWVQTKNASDFMSIFHYDGTNWKKLSLPKAFSSGTRMMGTKTGKGIWLASGSTVSHYQPELDKNP